MATYFARGTGKTATQMRMMLWEYNILPQIYEVKSGFKIKGFRELKPFKTEDEAIEYFINWIIN